MKTKSILEGYVNTFKFNPIEGRYITANHLERFYDLCKAKLKVDTIGYSVENREIKSITIGTGACKVFAWSQMHGNESTTTKGLIDFIHMLLLDEAYYEWFTAKYTFVAIPILNPDGAFHYTRVNANNVDLNRDALNQSQPESIVLRTIYNTFKPDYCLNLHDQRTIYGFEDSDLPATFSFLAPAFNSNCDYNSTRLHAVNIINHIVNDISDYLPNQIGRYDDAFNENCVGDYFTKQGTPAILFEAGHFQNDYSREDVRKIVFLSLKSAFNRFIENVVVDVNLPKYLNIPQNLSCFNDFIFENFSFVENNSNKIINFALQYDEIVSEDTIVFKAKLVDFTTSNKRGHLYFNGLDFKDAEIQGDLIKGAYANFSIGNHIIFKEGIRIK